MSNVVLPGLDADQHGIDAPKLGLKLGLDAPKLGRERFHLGLDAPKLGRERFHICVHTLEKVTCMHAHTILGLTQCHRMAPAS